MQNNKCFLHTISQSEFVTVVVLRNIHIFKLQKSKLEQSINFSSWCQAVMVLVVILIKSDFGGKYVYLHLGNAVTEKENPL